MTREEGADRVVQSQRAAAHRVARTIEAGEVLQGLDAKFAACIVKGMALNRYRGRGRPPSNSNDVEYRSACKRAAGALQKLMPIAARDRPFAAEALRGFARQVEAPPKPRNRGPKVPPDAAILVEVQKQFGSRSKRATIDAIAEMHKVDSSNVRKAVAKSRSEAKAFIEKAMTLKNAKFHPKK